MSAHPVESGATLKNTKGLKLISTSNQTSQLGYSVIQAAKAAGCGRSTIYEELTNGKLRARKLGRRTVILASDLATWLASLPQFKS
jgi:excisionase family DNA binding protein